MHRSKIMVAGQFLLLAVAFLLPILFLPVGTLSVEPLKMFLVLLTGVVLGIVLIAQKIKRNSFFVTKNLLWLSIGAILLSSLLSTVFSSNVIISLFGRQISFSSLLGIFVLFSLSYSVSVLFEDARHKSRLFLATYFSMLLVILMHLLHIFIPAIPSFGFFVSNTANTIGRWYELGFVALFLLLSSSLILQFFGRSKFFKVCGIVGMTLSTILLILVNSLMLWVLGAVFAFAYVVFNAMTHHDEVVQSRISYPVLGILIFSVIFVLVGPKVSVIVKEFVPLQFQEVRPTLASTGEVIGDTLKTKPLFGEGLNRFEVSWLANKPQGVNESEFWDTGFTYGVSNILSVPVTHGILGILAWIFFIVASVYYASKLMVTRTEQKSDMFIRTYSILGFTFFLATMMVYAPSVVLIALFFIFLGFFISNLNHAGLVEYKEVIINDNPRKSFIYILSLVVALIVFVYAGFIVVSQYASRVMFDNASIAYSQTGDLANAETQISKAQFVYSSDIYLRALSEIGALSINQLLQAQDMPEDQMIERFQNALRMTVGYAQAAIEYDPQSYPNRIALLEIYKNLIALEVSGAKDEALRVIDEAATLVPNNPSTHLERARIHALSKEFDQAVDEIRIAIELKPNFIDAVFLLSQIQVERGEIDQAVASIQSALSVDSRNSNLHFQLGLLRYNQQRYSDSIVSFENSVILSPFFGNAKYFLGLSYYQNDRAEEAIAQFEDLVMMYPDNQEVAFILNNLKSGKEPFDGVQPPLDARPESRGTPPVTDTDESVTEVPEE